MPAFETVSSEIEINEIKHTKFNSFYKEYAEATRLAKIILKRFGYNINNAPQIKTIKTPPFWIDMAKLFELYVLGLLKNEFGNEVTYHLKIGRGNELDYLLNNEHYKMVVDAKYKTIYKTSLNTKDMRQVSGYARLKKVYDLLSIQTDKIIPCLIIYPDNEGIKTFENVKLTESEIKKYVYFYKLGVKLPEISDEVVQIAI